jgi:hypothetical protein
MNRHLIEFDIRVAPERIPSHPEDDRYRAEFLLRPDVRWPMSVDGMIWPSVFFLEQCRDPLHEYGTVPIDQVREEAWPWLNLAKMRGWPVGRARRSCTPSGRRHPPGVRRRGRRPDQRPDELWIHPEEIASWRPKWGPRLNDRGLLCTLEEAVAFREATDHRVEEHAPFWVYALWQLPE